MEISPSRVQQIYTHARINVTELLYLPIFTNRQYSRYFIIMLSHVADTIASIYEIKPRNEHKQLVLGTNTFVLSYLRLIHHYLHD